MLRLRTTFHRGYVHAIRAALALTLLTTSVSLSAQHFSDWSPAVKVGPPVSTTYNDACPFIAKDDLTLYFFSNRPDVLAQGNGDLYVTHRDSTSDPWDTPQNLGPTINSPNQEFCPAVTTDGHWLFFTSDRPGGCGGLDTWVAYRSTPVNLGCTVNSASNDLRHSLQEADGEGQSGLYFSSDRPGGLGNFDIYFSSLNSDGTFAPPVLVVELSSPSADLRPSVRKDGLEIFFDSDRPETLGLTDFWVSMRESTAAPWSPPVHLGPEVNSSGTEGGAAISFDGSTLYFMSTGFGSLGANDIYQATRTKVHGPK